MGRDPGGRAGPVLVSDRSLHPEVLQPGGGRRHEGHLQRHAHLPRRHPLQPERLQVRQSVLLSEVGSKYRIHKVHQVGTSHPLLWFRPIFSCHMSFCLNVFISKVLSVFLLTDTGV